MKIITSGHAYTDIDVFACALGLKNLYDLQKILSEIVLPGPLNESISKTIKAMDIKYKQTADEQTQNEYILVDISDPNYTASFVKESQITKIYDHHPGFEKYWEKKLGDNAKIESVGSCATLMWEEFKTANLQDKINKDVALLMYTAIISNTLNLNAKITSDRDRQALKEIHHHITIPEGWAEKYYEEISESVLTNPEKAMKNDTKIVEIHGEKYGIIQTELWESEPFIKKHYELIINILQSIDAPHKFLTSPNIAHDFNYLITQDESVKKQLSEKLDATFTENIGKTKKLWLRKEIIKALNE